MRRQAAAAAAPENLRPVNIVNSSTNLRNSHGIHDYGSRSNVSRSSTGSGRQGHANNGIVQKHGSSYAVEGVAHQPNGQVHYNQQQQQQQQLVGRRTASSIVGQGGGKFRVSMPPVSNNGGGR